MAAPEGYVKLYRCLMEKAIWTQSKPEQKVVLITLLMMANHQEREWIWNGDKFKAEPGQFVTSLQSIVTKSGVSIRSVRTALVNFEKLEFLTNKTTKTGRLINIVNWGVYQGWDEQTDKETDKAPTKHRQSTDKAPTTNKNDKNDKNDKNVKNIYAEFVTMTEEEHKKLIEQFGETGTNERVENLNLYKGSKGVKYKNDYMTILNWERKANKEATNETPKQNPKQQSAESKRFNSRPLN